MKLSSRARYAMRMMVALARLQRDHAVSLGEVARATKIPRRTLDQVAVGLKNARLIIGQSGKSGGYRLTRKSEDIAVGEIIEAAVGPINIVDCVREPQLCIKADLCECRWVYEQINARITDVLKQVSLADLSMGGQSKTTCRGEGSLDPACLGG